MHVGTAGTPPRSPSCGRSTCVPAAGSIDLRCGDRCPLHKHSTLSWVRVSCLESCAPSQGWRMGQLATNDFLTQRHKGWALPQGEKNSMGHLWPRASGGAWLKLVCRRTLPYVAFLPCQIVLSQVSFSWEHSLNKALPRESLSRALLLRNPT